MLALAGSVAAPSGNQVYVAVVVSIAVACVVREVFFPTAPIPQVGRQTPGRWARQHPGATGAFLWGVDIGLVLTTWLTLSGTWLVLVLAILSETPLYGALIVLAYWGGRSLSVWLGPAMTGDAAQVADVLETLRVNERRIQLIHALALIVLTCLIGISTLLGTEALRNG